MTHAGEFLRRHLQRGEQRQFAAEAGLTDGHLSKILHGERMDFREQTLAGILRALPEKTRVPFLTAYVRDLVPEEYGEIFTPTARETRARKAAAASETKADYSDLEAALREHFRAPKRDEVACTLESLVRNAAASPEFLRGLEEFAKVNLG